MLGKGSTTELCMAPSTVQSFPNYLSTQSAETEAQGREGRHTSQLSSGADIPSPPLPTPSHALSTQNRFLTSESFNDFSE